jgi:hypothetical protein
MLPFPVIAAKSHPFASGTNCSPHLHLLHSVRCHPACTEPSRSERSEGSAFLLRLATRHSPLTTIPFRIKFFAYPHPLTPIESHSCKNRGEGVPFTPSRVRGVSCVCATHSNARKPFPLMGLLYGSLDTRGWGSLLTIHHPLPTLHPLKPPLQMAHPYLCTCKKGPAARETRYPPCAVS